MRKNFSNFSLNRGLKLSFSGKVSLAILLIIIVVLTYQSVEAKEISEKDYLGKALQIDNKIGGQTEKEKEQFQKVFYSEKDLMNSFLIPSQEEIIRMEEDLRVKNKQEKINEDLKKEVAKELKGTLMEPMIDSIASYDRETAALLVGIAKIESGYKHHNSYNFWGYAGGNLGFKNHDQAVAVVAKRIEQLRKQGLNTPAKLVTTWKCGRSCASHPKESVTRWVSTVSGPYYRIMGG